MFVFIFVASLRLLGYAANATPADRIHVPDSILTWWDFGSVAYLAVAFSAMWWTHWQGSRKERKYYEAMR
jgi:hypothetical protein